MGSKKSKRQKAIKSTSEIKAQAPVGAVTKDLVTVLNNNKPLIARSNLDLEQVQFQNDLFTQDLLTAVREHAEIIQTLLTTKSKIDIRIGEELSGLRNQFFAYAAKNDLDKGQADDAFSEFVQEVFDLKPSRAVEYIKVAENKILEGVKLPISSLVELSRLKEDVLEGFLEEHPVEELSKKSFREIQSLVRDNNENKQNRQSKATAATHSVSDSDTSDVDSKSIKATLDSLMNSDETSQSQNDRDSVVVLPRGIESIEDDIEQDNEELDETELSQADLEVCTARLRIAFQEFKPTVDKLGIDQNALDLLAEISQFFAEVSKKGGA